MLYLILIQNSMLWRMILLMIQWNIFFTVTPLGVISLLHSNHLMNLYFSFLYDQNLQRIFLITCSCLVQLITNGIHEMFQIIIVTGWQGLVCTLPCSNHTYGNQCNQTCRCSHGDCNPFTGECTCHPGYQGALCNQPCPVRMFNLYQH